ncbi:MAG TPA: molybdopterin-dependent oxidoreductase [Candidatus Acidoferrales bacterium]|jgi:DMSO/TMAO reductase YedYZ molybdopterin-dependent catalytic subunit|nr:molybdopterin-dependent oxidoreductase [Candidatus Acidoferrales bacterium]
MSDIYRRISRRQMGFALVGALTMLLGSTGATLAQSNTAAPASGAALTVSGDVSNPLTLSLDALKNMPRKTIHVNNEHAQEEEVYEGVALAAILKQAGVPQGGQIRGKVMASYVLAQGGDGYQVLFSLPELDSDFENSDVLVADTMGGKPINDKLGPLRLVVPHDKRPARWVRMLTEIKVVRLNKQE